MTSKIHNFFNAIAPLAQSDFELEDLLIISLLENAWRRKKQIQVNDIVQTITNLSASTIHRRLRKMKINKTLQYVINEENQRVRFITRGTRYEYTLKKLNKVFSDVHIQTI